MTQMSTSFECDGCGHHASFHSMENPADSEVIKRWTEQSQESQTESGADRPRKRPRKAIGNGSKESEETPEPEPSVTAARTKRQNGAAPIYLQKTFREVANADARRKGFNPPCSQRVQEIVEVEE